MFLRHVAVTAILLAAVSGCARSPQHLAAQSFAAPAPAKPPVEETIVHGDTEGLLPDDPMAKVTPVGFGTTSVEAEPESETTYLLGAGDRIRVFVYGQPNLSRVYPIDGAGFIAMPLVGSVKAYGLTTYDLTNSIATQLREKYVRDPEVTVEIDQYRPFAILGEVRNAGQFPYQAGMSAEMAVALAGGFGPRADERNIQITRVIDGERQSMTVAPGTSIKPGDTIMVKERFL